MLEYNNYSTFLNYYENKILQQCVENLDFIEPDIVWNNADWYCDQLEKELKSKSIVDYIEEYFNKIHKITVKS